MVYPIDLDTFAGVAPLMTISSAEWEKMTTAIAALQAKVGVDGSGVTTSLDYRSRYLDSIIRFAPSVSVTAAAIANDATITTAGVETARVAPTAHRTGIRLQSGTVAGQWLTVKNESDFLITFDPTPSTSRVLHLTPTMTVPPNGEASFRWDAVLGLWVELSAWGRNQRVFAVTWFGSVTTDAATTTATVHRARDALGANGTLYFPTATYAGAFAATLTQAWELGPGAWLKVPDGSTGDVLEISATNFTLTGPRGSGIDGNRSGAGSSGTPVWVQSTAAHCRIEGIELKEANGTAAIVVHGDHIRLHRLYIHDCDNGGVLISNADTTVAEYASLDDITVETCAGDFGVRVIGDTDGWSGTETAYGTYLNNVRVFMPGLTGLAIEVWGRAYRSRLTSCFTSGGAWGISLDSASESTLSGSIAVGAAEIGIELAGCSRTTAVANQVIGLGITVQGFSISTSVGAGLDDNVLAANVVSGCGAGGAAYWLASGASRWSLMGNHCANCPEGIRLETASWITIQGGALDVTGTRAIVWGGVGSHITIGGGLTIRGATEKGIDIWAPSGTIEDVLIDGSVKYDLGVGAVPIYFEDGPTYTNIEYWLPRADAAPTTGKHVVGGRVRVATPTAGGVEGRVCVAAGEPGTWKTYGTIAA